MFTADGRATVAADKVTVLSNSASDALPESEWLSVGLLEEETSKLLKPFSTEIPVLIRDTARSAGIKQADSWVASGAVHGGRIHLFRDGLADRPAVVRTLWHELFHFGLRRFMTEPEYIAKMGDLYKRDRWIRTTADDWANTAEAQKLAATKSLDYVRARGVDEALAELAEILQTNKSGYQTNTLQAQVIRAVRDWVARIADFFGFKEAAQEWRGYAAQNDARDMIVSTFSKLREGALPSMQNSKWHYSDPAFMAARHGKSVVEFDGKELGGKSQPIGELVAKARDFARRMFADKTVTATDGHEIMIPWGGIKHTFSGKVSANAAIVASKLDKVIESGVLVKSAPD